MWDFLKILDLNLKIFKLSPFFLAWSATFYKRLERTAATLKRNMHSAFLIVGMLLHIKPASAYLRLGYIFTLTYSRYIWYLLIKKYQTISHRYIYSFIWRNKEKYRYLRYSFSQNYMQFNLCYTVFVKDVLFCAFDMNIFMNNFLI